MKILLRIDSSMNLDSSFSRSAADHYETLWKKKHPEAHVLYRDLEKSPVPHLTQKIFNAFAESSDTEDPNLNLSNELIGELESADTILISTPVYNYSVPSTLKAYIDHIIRINKTFCYDPENHTRQGQLTGKSAVIIVARGGLPIQGKSPDGVEDYLTAILNFIGVGQVETFSISGTLHLGSERQLDHTLKAITEFHNN